MPETYPLATQLNKVALYADRGLLHRTGSLELPAGTVEISIENLPDNFDQDSLQVNAKGVQGATLLDVKVKREFHQETPHQEILKLQKQLQELLDEDQQFANQEGLLASRREYLNAIANYTAEGTGREIETRPPSVEDWEKMIDFQTRQRTQLEKDAWELQIQRRELKKKIAKVQADLKKVQAAGGKWRRNVIVSMDLQTAGELELELGYQIYNASWRPVYEARVDTETKTVKLLYAAMVTQQTGEDWNGIALELSTARPQLGGNPPNLSEWVLREYIPPVPRKPMALSAPKRRKKMEREEEEDMAMNESMVEPFFDEAPAPEPVAVRSATVEAGAGANVQFLVPGEVDVPGDGGSSRHRLMEHELGSEFRFLTIPKLAELAYLTAEVTNDSGFPLLPGQMNIFRDGAFVGKSELSELVTDGETFDLSLGVDEAIRVNRKLNNLKGGEKGFFSKNRRIEWEYLISIENRRKTNEEIIVRDQLPVPRDEKIQVMVEEISPDQNPEMDKEKLPRGTVEWKLHVASGDKQRCRLSFRVEHPPEMDVVGL